MDAIQTTPTTIFIFWTIPTDVSYSEVTWRQAAIGLVNGAADNIGSSGRLSTDTNSFRIEDLKSGTSYTIHLTVSNPAGNSSVELTQSTNKAGEHAAWIWLVLLSLQFAGARAKQWVVISHYCWKCGSSCDYCSTGGCDPASGVVDHKKIQGESQCSIYKVRNFTIVTFVVILAAGVWMYQVLHQWVPCICRGIWMLRVWWVPTLPTIQQLMKKQLLLSIVMRQSLNLSLLFLCFLV